jgi:hypothetical protein
MQARDVKKGMISFASAPSSLQRWTGRKRCEARDAAISIGWSWTYDKCSRNCVANFSEVVESRPGPRTPV